MKLYLMQHGQAMAKEQDPERPLTQQGRQDVDRLGQFLRQAGVRVVRVIHSGKLRARQSAETLAEVVTPGLEPEVSGLLGP
ncbi:MAG: histidine phosphatase family protein, partial [Chromatiales bacterium]